MREPKHQRILKGFYYIFLGYCLLGGFFSATNNVRTLISPMMSLLLALAALAVWFFVELYLRESPILWVSLKGEPARIKGFGPMRRLGFVGGILLLLVPFVLDRFNGEQRKHFEARSNSKYGTIYEVESFNEATGRSEPPRISDDSSKTKLKTNDDKNRKRKPKANNDGENESEFRTHNDTEINAVKGITLHGVERGRPVNLNKYPEQWLASLRKRGAKLFVYSNALEMVDGVLAQLDEGQFIQELNLYGYGRPGLFSVGNGQGDDYRDLTYLAPDELSKEEWRNLLEPLKDYFLPDARINLIGCYVGAEKEGAELLYYLSKTLDVKVSAPVGIVHSPIPYRGKWQLADPEWDAPPPPILARR